MAKYTHPLLGPMDAYQACMQAEAEYQERHEVTPRPLVNTDAEPSQPRYTFAASLSWGGDIPTAELEDVVVTYTVTWGAPARGPSYASGGEPADPDEIDDVQVVSIDGVPWDQCDHGYGGREYLHEAIVDKLIDCCWDAMIETAIETNYDPRED